MAGRIPKPWFRKSKGAWFVYLHGKAVRLGADKAEALRAYHRLLGEQQATPKATATLTVKTLGEQYLADLQRRVTARTATVADCYLKPILKHCGAMLVETLRRQHVDAAVRAHGQWNDSTEYHVKCRIMAMLNWAVAEELIPANPVKGLKKPPARSRGREALVSDDVHAKLLAGAPPWLKDVLTALRESGARPGEVLTVTAQQFDADRGLWLLENHKTRGKTGAVRAVFLTPTLTELCRRLAKEHPAGPLFRTARGKAWPEGSYYLARLLAATCKRLGLPQVIPYGYRHTFATDALLRGVPDAHVAELLGHRGTHMLHRHYSHLGAKAKALADALTRIRA